ncbi:MAG: cation transporter [Hyphomicrobiales bacterium]|nr:cation transporter [Hyphomicrobiales bacterium]MBV9113776.1 cation transporter [Hyphomicrobiales bacterium]
MLRATFAAVLVISLSPLGARAAEKTILLDVENATCGLCAPIVKKTLSRVMGVKAVQVAEATANSDAVATVTFDDASADVGKLITATTNAGYPAHLKN